ncbi:hypothetical protein JAAARDRAFT_134081 [Jaapia argillacea MUCL 33604]|uniref:Cytochrome P450 n=1 Tax=Jaapia argillacea MUCL 33604 TaxID=933084 RepID=A0A067PYH2_9AGAM|nr:hypothetical protein JAAARDRAFT_134081 [Jaapia argillacea MUCL 33604]
MATIQTVSVATIYSAAFILGTLLCKLLWNVFHNLVIYPHRSPLRNIPGPPPQSWFKGNLGQLFNSKGLKFHHDIVEGYGGVVKVYGFFGDEQLYISDPRVLQSIILKDQDAFEETQVFIETNKIIFGEGLVATTGAHHKRQRRLVNPIFSMTNLRKLVPVFYEIANKLADVLGKEAQSTENQGLGSESKAKSIDMSSWMSRVALESVGRTILGYSFDPLDTPSSNPYTAAIRELIPTLFKIALLRQFAPFLARLGPAWFRRKLVELTPNDTIQKVKNMSDVMYNAAKEILRRKKEEKSQLVDDDGSCGTTDKDLLNVLMRTNMSASHGEQLSEEEIIGQMTVMIFGAQDTTSSALSRILYMLSIRPDIQDMVRQEIKSALTTEKMDSDGNLDLDGLSGLPWLEAVIKETLRLYPPVPFVRRSATKTIAIPVSCPIESSNPNHPPMSTVTIPSGTTLFVGMAAANRSQAIWGNDAKEWKPERWLSGTEPAKMTDGLRLPGIYAGTLTFFGGERSCIGYKFAQIEMKIILSTLLTRFSFSATGDEIVWNLSQIISPSVRERETGVERQGLPLRVDLVRDS